MGKLNNQLYFEGPKPLDSKGYTTLTMAQYSQVIPNPYVGLKVYSAADDKEYKITALTEDGLHVASYEEVNTGGQFAAQISVINDHILRLDAGVNSADLNANTAVTKAEAAASAVEQLTGLEGSNFLGIFATMPSTNDLLDGEGMTTGWCLVGDDLANLKAYKLSRPNTSVTKDPEQIGDKTYDFTDYSGIKNEHISMQNRIEDVESRGITNTTVNLIIDILRHVVYDSDVSDKISLLETYLKQLVTNIVYYSVTISGEGASLSNSEQIRANKPYLGNVIVSNDKQIESIIVTMGGIDITEDVLNGDEINIPSVTGNISISVITKEKPFEPAVTGYTDFVKGNTASYTDFSGNIGKQNTLVFFAKEFGTSARFKHSKEDSSYYIDFLVGPNSRVTVQDVYKQSTSYIAIELESDEKIIGFSVGGTQTNVSCYIITNKRSIKLGNWATTWFTSNSVPVTGIISTSGLVGTSEFYAISYPKILTEDNITTLRTQFIDKL